MGSPVHRIVRNRRLFDRAASILERDAQVLHDSHTINGEWRDMTDDDRRAKADVEEARKIAAELRRMAGGAT